MKDIFEIERRINPTVYYERIINLTNDNCYEYGMYSSTHNLWELIDNQIMQWKYKNGACSSEDYLHDLEIIDLYDTDENQQLLVIQFILNMIHFFEKAGNVNVYSYEHRPYKELIDMIKFYLEKVNYQIYTKDDKIKLTKRDVDVDSVLQSDACDETLTEYLLSYYDVRNKNDIECKREILEKIANWLEPNRDHYETIDKTLTKLVFKMFNNSKIRHNNEKQYLLSENEIMKYYDYTFKLVLHLIRTEDIRLIQEDIDKLDNKKS